MLETCYREGGMLAPFAASTWAAYQLDAKTFLGERQTPDDFKRCRRMFRWARKRYYKDITWVYLIGIYTLYTLYSRSISATDTYTHTHIFSPVAPMPPRCPPDAPPMVLNSVLNICRYPHSILLGILEADMIGCRDRDVNAARELLESLTPHVGPELKGEAYAIGGVCHRRRMS